MDELDLAFRPCGICKKRDIPRGIDWPWWVDGLCVHYRCALSKAAAPTIAQVLDEARQTLSLVQPRCAPEYRSIVAETIARIDRVLSFEDFDRRR